MKKILIILFFSLIGNIYAVSIYDFKVKDIKGNEISLSSYKGSTILIVNVASKCGYTYQYEGLEKLFKKYIINKFISLIIIINNGFGKLVACIKAVQQSG